MIKTVIAVLTAIYALWKRYWSKDANILKLKKRRKEIKKELKRLRMEIRRAKPEEEDELISIYSNLDIERLQIAQDISDLHS